ncbi:potassium channel family protein [Pokkaliibacter sp. CJK22405]|uniref:potassium channel family protein n=1 Tax=Pokkaliibacter sp. CJK22405 TaxID=3384615 RepID=UPI0039856ABE
MKSAMYLLLRRLRLPLISLIVVYAVSITGFVLIPGQDDQGQPWQMGFFHAFYFVSFMGSTIGFGEIPYPFTDAQRYWAMLTIYATVIVWLYSIGTMLSVLQDPAFSRVRSRHRFRNAVRQIQEPFYLVCGYGLTGGLLVKMMAERGLQTVVVDIDQSRVDDLETDSLGMMIPAYGADASQPDVLKDAGLLKPNCIGVIALTNNDEVNLAIAIAGKLLTKETPVISRAENDSLAANLASFGTDHIINPFTSFAEYMAMAIHAPYRHLVYDWLVNPRHRPLQFGERKPRGNWVICGYGRMGTALHKQLQVQNVELVVVEPDPAKYGLTDNMVEGLGTEAVTLEQADIREAAGLVAATASDANNLSILMTAREINPDLITVVRQNQRYNEAVFKAAKADYVMDPSGIMANRIMMLIKSPLLLDFLSYLPRESDEWAYKLIMQMRDLVGQEELDSWSFTLNDRETPALITSLNLQEELPLSLFLHHPGNRKDSLPALALMLKRQGEVTLLPATDTQLQAGDQLLFCGDTEAYGPMSRIAYNYNMLTYVRDGYEGASGTVWRWLNRRFEGLDDPRSSN